MTPRLSIRAVRLVVAVILAALVAGGCAVEPPASPIRISHPTSLAGT